MVDLETTGLSNDPEAGILEFGAALLDPGSDAVTTATWILAQTTKLKVGTAIMQMPARTPAMAAMTAMSLDQLSGGRFILGLGPSHPQVVYGCHCVPFC